MSEKTEKRRAELRTRLVDAAEAAIVADGIAAVKARDLAKQANCAVGAIYNVFADMTQLVMAVNGRTFPGGLGRRSRPSWRIEPMPCPQINWCPSPLPICTSPRTIRTRGAHYSKLRCRPISRSHIGYQEQLAGLFGLIRLPLSRLRPDLADEELSLLTRALFSSVHGIVSLGLEKRISGVPVPEMEKMISMIIKHFAGEPSKM